MDRDLKYNVIFLTSLKLFTTQVQDWVEKIAKIDYDEIAKLVSDFEDNKELFTGIGITEQMMSPKLVPKESLTSKNLSGKQKKLC